MIALEIRRLSAMEDLTRASDVVLEVTGYRDIYPGVLRSIVDTGGYVAAAYNGDRMIGAIYALVGIRDEVPYLHSEMLVVLPQDRGRGVARALKIDQRAFAIEHGFSVVTWTFDPLRGPNANLNIRRLGGEIAGYVPDMYGSLPGFSGGWPTDQLLVEWHVSEPLACDVVAGVDLDRRFDLSTARELTRVSVRDDGLAELDGWTPGLTDPVLLLRVPPNAQEMRERDMAAVLRWRFGIRDAFLHYLDAGYEVTWFVPQREPISRNVYVLSARRR